MRRLAATLLATLAAAVLLASGAPAARQAAAPGAGPTQISGHVKNAADDTPIARALPPCTCG